MTTPPAPLPEYSEPLPPPRSWALSPEPEPVFGLLEVVFVAGFLLLAVVFCGVAAIFLAHALPAYRGLSRSELASNPQVLLPAQLLAYLMLLAMLWRLFAKYHQMGMLDALHWRWPRRWGILLVSGVVLAVAAQGASALLPTPPELPIDQMIRTPLDAWLMMLFGVAFAPFVEEVLFRGLLFPALARRLGGVTSLLVTAILFGGVHSAQLGGSWAQVGMIVAVGGALTAVRWRWRSLAASTLVHMGYNGALFAALFIQTKGFTHLTGH
ncbi:MAG: type II CAAX endopeptidase family protein [Acidobacteriota bacterium]|nr:type II CAAX endopeptidase family protein [Acidobacteriota bacterium]